MLQKLNIAHGSSNRKTLASAAMHAMLTASKGEAKAPVPDLRIAGMLSDLGEEVSLLAPVGTRDRSVEVWMADFERSMKACVQHAVAQCTVDYDGDSRLAWVEVRPTDTELLHGCYVCCDDCSRCHSHCGI
jgi:hypothetical protein